MRYRPSIAAGLRLAFVLALVVILWQALAPAPLVGASLNDKLLHFLAFAGLALLADYAWLEARFGWQQVAALALYGALIELLQHLVPGRDFSLLDLFADVAGLSLYWAIGVPLRRYLVANSVR